MIDGNQEQKVTSHQNALLNASMGAHYQSKNNTMKILLIASAVVIGLLCVFLLVIIIKNNSGKDESPTTQQKTTMMKLYEGLDDKMTYEELDKKVRDVSEDIEIVFDDGMYVIKSNDGEIDDFITCSILTEQDKIDEESDQELVVDEDESADNQAILKKILETIVDEDESKWPDENTENNDSETVVNPYDETLEINSTEILSYFMYHYYTEIENSIDETILTELTIQPNLEVGGYYLSNGTDVMEYPTKSDAIDDLLQMSLEY